ncbi:protein kinase family protein, partial [Reticulomyxa filosa]
MTEPIFGKKRQRSDLIHEKESTSTDVLAVPPAKRSRLNEDRQELQASITNQKSEQASAAQEESEEEINQPHKVNSFNINNLSRFKRGKKKKTKKNKGWDGDIKKKELEGLDAYEKIDRLGEGTYGIVYKAKDRRNGKTVALKRTRETSDMEEG